MTAPDAHRTARPMHTASIDSLHMTVVEHRARSSSSTRSPTVRNLVLFPQPASRIEDVCLLVLFKFLQFYFHFKTKHCDFGFACCFKPGSVLKICMACGSKSYHNLNIANTPSSPGGSVIKSRFVITIESRFNHDFW